MRGVGRPPRADGGAVGLGRRLRCGALRRLCTGARHRCGERVEQAWHGRWLHPHGVMRGAGVELGGGVKRRLQAADGDRSVARAGGGGRGRPRVRPTAAPEAARGGLSAARGGTAASHEVTWRRCRPDRVFLDCGLVLPGCVRACQGWEAPGETLCRHYCLWPWRRRPRASFSPVGASCWSPIPGARGFSG